MLGVRTGLAPGAASYNAYTALGAPVCGSRPQIIAEGVKRGRPTRQMMQDEAERPKLAKASAAPKKRGPKPKTSAPDHLAMINPEVLEELKRKAAEEEGTRELEPADDENNPQRFAFHKILMNAASRGLPDEAEQVLAQMHEAGLPPGRRAYHALVFAYVRAKMPYDALDAAKDAIEQGMLLLPETFIILIFSLLNHPEEPDVETAQQVLESMYAQDSGTGTGGTSSAQAGWLMLCKELFRKGASQSDMYKKTDLVNTAMTSVKAGYNRGYVSDPDLAEFVIEQLTKAGMLNFAYKELDTLVAVGHRPGPRHYNHVIKTEAARGAWSKARKLLKDSFSKPTWSPPNIDSFNALLQGMVISVDPDTGLPTGPDANSDDLDLYDFTGADDGSQAKQILIDSFKRLVEEVLHYGLRPNAASYAATCSGYVKVRALDEALGAFQAMTEAGGTTELMSKKRLSSLLTQLAEEDRPADLLNVLKALVASNQKLPKAAAVTLDHVVPGTTLTTAWLPAHFEYMRAHQDDGTGKGAGGSALSSLRTMLEQAREVVEYDGILLSSLGGCAVDEDGVLLKPSKMTLDQLRAELDNAGIPFPEEAKRTQLAALVKERREGLSQTVKDVYAHLEAARKAEQEALEKKVGKATVEDLKSKRGRKEIKEFRVIQMEEGKMYKVTNILQEVVKRRTSYTVERGGVDPYGLGDGLDEEGMNRPGDEDDELNDIMKEGLDEGVKEILRDEDTTFGDAGEVVEGTEQQNENDGLEMTIDHIEARLQNRTAGMRVAFDVLRCIELLGGAPTGPDYEALVAGVVAENNADVALELSDRLHNMLDMGYSQEAVAGLYEQLARVCLTVLRAGSADLILERAEDLQLEIDPSLYAMLNKALGNKPRHRTMAAAEIKDMVEDTATAKLMSEDEETEEGEENQPAGLLQENVDDIDDDEETLYGRATPGGAQANEDVSEETDQLQLQDDPDWQAEAPVQDGVRERSDAAQLSFGLLSAMDERPLPDSALMDLQDTAEALMNTYLLKPETDQDQGEEKEEEVIDLGDGTVASRSQVDALEAALSRGASSIEALLEAGLITPDEAEDLDLEDLLDDESPELLLPAGIDHQETDDDDEQLLSELAQLLGGDLLENVHAAQEEILELQAQLDAGEFELNEEGAQAAVQRINELQAYIEEELAPRMAQFLDLDITQEQLQSLQMQLDTQLADNIRYRNAARELCAQQAAAAGIDVDAALAEWDASQPLAELASRPDQPVLRALQDLSQAQDSEELMDRLIELETAAPQAGVPVALPERAGTYTSATATAVAAEPSAPSEAKKSRGRPKSRRSTTE